MPSLVHRSSHRILAAFAATGLLLLLNGGTTVQAQPAPAAAAKPTLWLIGDSTVNNNANGGLGWGMPAAIDKLFDPAKITIKNQARGGRSARSYYSEGLWDAIKPQLKPGDFVLMQFGTNDGGDPKGANSKGRPDLPGIGEETTTGIASVGGKEETVHTFGWYMKAYVDDTKAKGATPIMLTMVPHDRWVAGKVGRDTDTFVKWSRQIAENGGAYYINLNDVTAMRLEKSTEAEVTAKYFTPPGDRTHTNPAGAALNAESVVMGIRALKDLKLNDMLSDAGKALVAADAEDVEIPKPAAKP